MVRGAYVVVCGRASAIVTPEPSWKPTHPLPDSRGFHPQRPRHWSAETRQADHSSPGAACGCGAEPHRSEAQRSWAEVPGAR